MKEREKIEKVNNFKVSQATKLPNSKAIKIIMKSQKMVTDACERGLLVFSVYNYNVPFYCKSKCHQSSLY